MAVWVRVAVAQVKRARKDTMNRRYEMRQGRRSGISLGMVGVLCVGSRFPVKVYGLVSVIDWQGVNPYI